MIMKMITTTATTTNQLVLCHLIVYLVFLNMNVQLISASDIDHCTSDRYPESYNLSFMQFTKEVNTHEYAVLDQFKGLHCCSKSYRSIEWFKDDKPYPWPKEISSFILYPEAGNQTIYITKISPADYGNYSCVLRNETHVIEHVIELRKVQDNIPDTPLATFQPKDQIVELGNSVRFYCEAFVGKIDLPDAKNYINWYQVFDNQYFQTPANGIQKRIEIDDGKIVGAYLNIEKTSLPDYSRYVCRIDIGNPDHRLEMSAWLFPATEDTNNLLMPLLLGSLAALITLFLVYKFRCFPLRALFLPNGNNINDNDCCKKQSKLDDSKNNSNIISNSNNVSSNLSKNNNTNNNNSNTQHNVNIYSNNSNNNNNSSVNNNDINLSV